MSNMFRSFFVRWSCRGGSLGAKPQKLAMVCNYLWWTPSTRLLQPERWFLERLDDTLVSPFDMMMANARLQVGMTWFISKLNLKRILPGCVMYPLLAVQFLQFVCVRVIHFFQNVKIRNTLRCVTVEQIYLILRHIL